MRALLIGALLGMASYAFAQKPAPAAPKEAREHFVRGRAHYDAGRYDEAITEYQAAYALLPKPELLFNIAQSYRLKGDARPALEYYRKYLAVAPEGDAAEESRNHVGALKRELDEADAAKRKAGEEEERRKQAEADAAASRKRAEQAEARSRKAEAEANQRAIEAVAAARAAQAEAQAARHAAEGSREQPVERSHAWQPGIQVWTDAFVTSFGATFGIGDYFEIWSEYMLMVGQRVQYDSMGHASTDSCFSCRSGIDFAGTFYLSRGAWKPMLSLGEWFGLEDSHQLKNGMDTKNDPHFFHGEGGVMWDPSRHFGIWLLGGVALLDDPGVLPFAALGLQFRL